MSVTYRLPYDTPLRYLPLVYILPHDLLMRCPPLRKLPRRMGAFNDPEWQEVLGSQQFRNEIMDAVAALVFPHFGFGGWKEHYTGYFPAWHLSYALPLWAKGIERERGWGPMLDVVREMPCAEDFEPWDTNVRKDFLRKWYHTRSKRVKTVSLEECMEDEDSGIHAVAGPAAEDFTEQVAGEDFCQRFKATLSPKDMAILELRVEGYGYQEIADKLGYKTHSAVVKRMEAIKRRFIQYEQEAGR